MFNVGEAATQLWHTAFLYVLAFLVVRAMGKRSIGRMAPFDVAVIIIIGEAVAIGIEEPSKPLWMAILPLIFLGVIQVVIAWLSTRWRPFELMTQGDSSVIMKDGQVIQKNLLRERISAADLITGLREQGMDRLADVKEARLEPSGKISVIPKEGAAPLSTQGLGMATGETLDSVVARHVERLRKEILSVLKERRPLG